MKIRYKPILGYKGRLLQRKTGKKKSLSMKFKTYCSKKSWINIIHNSYEKSGSKFGLFFYLTLRYN